MSLQHIHFLSGDEESLPPADTTHRLESTLLDSQFGNRLGHSARNSMNARTQRLMLLCTAVAIEIAWKMDGERWRISSMAIHGLGFRVKHTIVNNPVCLNSLPKQAVCRQITSSLLPARMSANVNYRCNKGNNKIWHSDTGKLLFPSLCAAGSVPYDSKQADKPCHVVPRTTPPSPLTM